MSDSNTVTASVGVESLSAEFLSAIRESSTIAWQRLFYLYGPVVYRWCVRSGMSPSDAEDAGQEVFASVASGLTRFRRDRPQDSFIAWLRTITRNKIADFWRRQQKRPHVIGGSSFQQSILQIPNSSRNTSPSSSGSEPSDRSIVISQALKLVQPKLQQKTWVAFWETAVVCRSTKDVAADLEMSEMAVRQAKSRVLRQLREQFDVAR